MLSDRLLAVGETPTADPQAIFPATAQTGRIWLVVLRMTGSEFPLSYFGKHDEAVAAAQAIGAKSNRDGLEDILTGMADVWDGGHYDTWCCLAVVPVSRGPGVGVPLSVDIVVDLNFMNDDPEDDDDLEN